MGDYPYWGKPEICKTKSMKIVFFLHVCQAGEEKDRGPGADPARTHWGGGQLQVSLTIMRELHLAQYCTMCNVQCTLHNLHLHDFAHCKKIFKWTFSEMTLLGTSWPTVRIKHLRT